jgi:hypothetical protein
MEKDESIVGFISRIKSNEQLSGIEIVDYWDSDLCSFGLKKNDRLVYISTFNYVNKSFVKYDFDFEMCCLDCVCCFCCHFWVELRQHRFLVASHLHGPVWRAGCFSHHRYALLWRCIGKFVGAGVGRARF